MSENVIPIYGRKVSWNVEDAIAVAGRANLSEVLVLGVDPEGEIVIFGTDLTAGAACYYAEKIKRLVME